MTRSEFSDKIRNVVRILSHRALGSSAILANEFYYAGIDFSILDRDSFTRDDVANDHYRGTTHATPIVLVPAGQAKNLKFLNERSREAFLRGDIVQIAASQGDNFDPVNYARHWTNRFAQRNVTALLPETIDLIFGAPMQTKRFELGRYPQTLVHQGVLDTELFNAAADVRNTRTPVIVYCTAFTSFTPGFMRLFTLSTQGLVVQR